VYSLSDWLAYTSKSYQRGCSGKGKKWWRCCFERGAEWIYTGSGVEAERGKEGERACPFVAETWQLRQGRAWIELGAGSAEGGGGRQKRVIFGLQDFFSFFLFFLFFY
jgi:hypothetical protein